PSVPLRVQVPVDAVHVQIPNGDPVDDAEVTRGDVDGAQVLVPVRVFIQPETGTEPGVQVGDLQAGNGDVFLVVQREHVLDLARAIEAGAVSFAVGSDDDRGPRRSRPFEGESRLGAVEHAPVL